MAAANGNKSRGPGSTSAAAASSSDDDRDIERLINGDGSGAPDGESSIVGESSDGSESESGNGGSESAGSGDSSGLGSGNGAGSERESGRTRTRTRRGNRSRNTGRTRANTSSEETRSVDDDVSRPLATPKQPKIELDTDDVPSTSAEIISDSFQFVFWGIGQATGLDDWDLDDDDARDIGRNGDKWLKSLGKKRASNIVKGLNKIGPSLAFFGSIGMALVPRVRVTINHAKDGTFRQIKAGKANGNSGGANQPVASSGSPVATGPANDNSAGERAIPFRPQDFGEVTQGFAGQDDGLPVS